jgi:hypothetical protein
MKHLSKLILVFAVCLTVSDGNGQGIKTNWEAFGENLVKAVATPNEGLQLSAMGMIIRHSDSLDVKDAVFDLVRIFRSHKDTRVRRLAMVTLSKIKVEWTMYFLKRNRQFEKDKTIFKHNCSIVNEYYVGKLISEEVLEQPLLSSSQ